jgi:hypothetical protein
MSRPEYNVLLSSWEGPEAQFEISDALRALLNGSISRATTHDKRQPVHQLASTCDALLAVHPNAIQIGAPFGTGEMVGTGNTFAVFSFGMMCLGIWMIPGKEDVLGWILSLVMFSIGFLFFSHVVRTTYLSPRDVPVVFNRKTREVTICLMRRARFWRFWERAGIAAVITTKWEHLQARSYRIMQLTGEAARETYVLRILWGEAQLPRKLDGFAPIGYLGWYEDEMLWQLWSTSADTWRRAAHPFRPVSTFARAVSARCQNCQRK